MSPVLSQTSLVRISTPAELLTGPALWCEFEGDPEGLQREPARILARGRCIVSHAETVLRRGNGADPQTLDPHKLEGVPEFNITADLFEGLTTYDAEAKVVPGAAESWDISDDGKVYTFHLRKDGKWSNGDPLKAEDFVYSLRRAVDPVTASPYSYILEPIVNAKEITGGTQADLTTLGVKAVDDYTVQITLVEPTAHFLQLMRHNISFPVNKAVVEKFGKDWTRPENMRAGGDFRLGTWCSISAAWPSWPTATSSIAIRATPILRPSFRRCRSPIPRSNAADGASC